MMRVAYATITSIDYINNEGGGLMKVLVTGAFSSLAVSVSCLRLFVFHTMAFIHGDVRDNG